MARELEGFTLAESEGRVRITKLPSPRLGRVLVRGLLLALVLGAGVMAALTLVAEGEWGAMAGPQRALSLGVVVTLLVMAVAFGRALYLSLDRGFRLEASDAGVVLRRHHFSRVSVRREWIAALRVHGRSYQPPRQPRCFQVRVGLELHELDEVFELLILGLGRDRPRDEPEQRARLSRAGLELGGALAEALGVALESDGVEG